MLSSSDPNVDSGVQLNHQPSQELADFHPLQNDASSQVSRSTIPFPSPPTPSPETPKARATAPNVPSVLPTPLTPSFPIGAQEQGEYHPWLPTVRTIRSPSAPENRNSMPFFTPTSAFFPNNDAVHLRVDSGGTLTDKEIWRAYFESAHDHDRDLVQGWQRSLDVLMILAGIFSVVLAVFLVALRASVDQKMNTYILAGLAQKMNVSDTAGALSSFVPPKVESKVIRLWVSALGFSVGTIILAMLARQWVHEYLRPSRRRRNDFRLRARIRLYRYEGLEWWAVPEIIACAPLLLHVAIFLFAAGLIYYLWEIDFVAAILLTVLTGVAAFGYIGTTLLPSFLTNCAYKTPITHLVSFIVHRFRRNALHDQEAADVEARAGVGEDKENLDWLRIATRDPNVAAAAMSELQKLYPQV